MPSSLAAACVIPLLLSVTIAIVPMCMILSLEKYSTIYTIGKGICQGEPPGRRIFRLAAAQSLRGMYCCE